MTVMMMIVVIAASELINSDPEHCHRVKVDKNTCFLYCTWCMRHCQRHCVSFSSPNPCVW